MAKEESDDLSLDLDASPVEGAEAKAPKNKKKIIIIAVAGVLLTVIIALSVLLVLKKKAKAKSKGVTAVKTAAKSTPGTEAQEEGAEPEAEAPAAEAPAGEQEAAAPEGEAKEEGGEGAGGAAKLPKTHFYSIKPAFVVNFISSGRGPKYLQVQVVLMTKSAAMVKTIENYLPLIKNEMVSLFSAKRYEELNTAEGKEALRREALLKIQQTLEREAGSQSIDSVLFESFVMQ